MKKYTESELKTILELHKKWLNGEKNGVRADLSYSDLSNSDLSNSDLSYSDLSGSNFSFSNLINSNLSGSSLMGCDLRHSILRGSDLSVSNLSISDLRNSDLSYSNLRSSSLRGSNLRGSSLRGSDLYCAIISNTNFKDTIYENKKLLTFDDNKHLAQYFGQDEIQIGCEKHSIEFWLKNFESVGKKNDYTSEQIKMYGKFIKQVYKTHFKVSRVG